MEVETVKMSSRGQVVIPQDVREELHAKEGTVFAIMGSKDTIILKKIKKPSKEEFIRLLTAMAKDGRKRLEKKGIMESDIPSIVQKSRRR